MNFVNFGIEVGIFQKSEEKRFHLSSIWKNKIKGI